MHPLCAFPFLKLVEPKMLHITTHFVGNVIEEQYTAILDYFLHTDFPSAKEIKLGGKNNVGRFGKRILFLRVEDSEKHLLQLHQACYRLFPQNDSTYDDSTYDYTAHFQPHVTLARNPNGPLLEPIEKQLNRFEWEITFVPSAISLMESLSTKGKMKYVERARVMLPHNPN